MQLEMYFKKEYVCKILSRRLKHFRHILRKDNELAHLLHQVTYVTSSDIKNFPTNLQIYESFNICLSPIQKKDKIQVNCIQVLVTTPNMEKPQKVFSFFLKKNKLFCGFSMGRNQYWAGRVYDLCVFSI